MRCDRRSFQEPPCAQARGWDSSGLSRVIGSHQGSRAGRAQTRSLAVAVLAEDLFLEMHTVGAAGFFVIGECQMNDALNFVAIPASGDKDIDIAVDHFHAGQNRVIRPLSSRQSTSDE